MWRLAKIIYILSLFAFVSPSPQSVEVQQTNQRPHPTLIIDIDYIFVS